MLGEQVHDAHVPLATRIGKNPGKMLPSVPRLPPSSPTPSPPPPLSLSLSLSCYCVFAISQRVSAVKVKAAHFPEIHRGPPRCNRGREERWERPVEGKGAQKGGGRGILVGPDGESARLFTLSRRSASRCADIRPAKIHTVPPGSHARINPRKISSHPIYPYRSGKRVFHPPSSVSSHRKKKERVSERKRKEKG